MDTSGPNLDCSCGNADSVAFSSNRAMGGREYPEFVQESSATKVIIVGVSQGDHIRNITGIGIQSMRNAGSIGPRTCLIDQRFLYYSCRYSFHIFCRTWTGFGPNDIKCQNCSDDHTSKEVHHVSLAGIQNCMMRNRRVEWNILKRLTSTLLIMRGST